MKKRFLRLTLSLIMAVVMFATSCLSAAAFAISAPNNNGSAWSLSYKDGVISLKINPEVLYGIVEDRQVSKEELALLVPEELLDLAENKDEISPAMLSEVLASYIPKDDLKAMVLDLPIELVPELIDVELIKTLITIEELTELVDIHDLFESVGTLRVEEMFEGEPMEAILTEDVIAMLEDNGIYNVDPDTIRMAEIAAAAGDYNQLFAMYSSSEAKDIVDAIGKDRLVDFVKDGEALKVIDYKEMLTRAIDHLKDKKEELKDFARAMLDKMLNILITDIQSISLTNRNGVEKVIFDEYFGQFDLNAILSTLVGGLPDVEDFLNIEPNGDIAAYTLKLTLMEDKYPLALPYTYGFSIGFEGDPARLQRFIAPLADNFVLDVDDDFNVNMSVSVPAVASAIYERVLVSDKTAALRSKLLAIPTMSISGVADTLADIDDEQISKVVEAVSEKADEIREKAYEKIDGAALPAESVDKAKDAVDGIIEKLLTVDTAKKLRDKAVTALRSLPAAIANKTIDDFYNTDTHSFTFEREFSVNLYDKISKVIALPADVKALFKDNMTISGSISIDAEIADLYRLTVISGDGSESAYYLPSGVSLSVLGRGEIYDGELRAVYAMPAQDTTLYASDIYAVIFAYGDTVIDTQIYIRGNGSSVKAPVIPNDIPEGIIKDGYSYEWESFADRLDRENRITVSLIEKKLENPSLNFYDVEGNRIGQAIEFIPGESTFEGLGIDALILAGRPAGVGYKLDVQPDLDKNEDQKIVVTYVYTLTFVDLDGNVIGEVVEFNPVSSLTFDDIDVSFLLANRPAGVTYKLSKTPNVTAPETADQRITVSYVYKLTFVDENGAQIGSSVEFSPSSTLTVEDLDLSFLLDGWVDGAYYEFYPEPELNAPAQYEQTITVKYTVPSHFIIFVDAQGREIGKKGFEPGKVDSLADFAKSVVTKNKPADVEFAFDAATLPELNDENAPVEQTVKVLYTYYITFTDAIGGQMGAAIAFDPFARDYSLYDFDTSFILAGRPAGLGYHFSAEPDFSDPASANQKVAVIYEYKLTFTDQQNPSAAPKVYTFDPLTVDMAEVEAFLLSGKLEGVEVEMVGDIDLVSPDVINQTVTFRYLYSITFVDRNGNAISDTPFKFSPESGLTLKALEAEIERYLVANKPEGTTFLIVVFRNTFRMRAATAGYEVVDLATFDVSDPKWAGTTLGVIFGGTVRFVDADDSSLVYAEVPFYEGDSFADILAQAQLPSVTHFTYSVDTPDLSVSGTKTASVKYTRVEGVITFVDDATGNKIGESIVYKAGDSLAGFNISFLNKPGYKYSFVSAPDFTVLSEQTIRVRYDKNQGTIKFVDKATGAQIGSTLVYKEGDGLNDLDLAFLERAGYTYVLENIPDLNVYTDYTVKVVYSLKTYTVYFVDENNAVVGTATYGHGQTSIDASRIPAPPTKRGYDVSWPTISLNNTDGQRITAVYTIKTYKATFKVDGVVIGVVEFNVNTQSITAPTVPEKAGYTGAWAAYQLPYYNELTPADIEIGAVYTVKILTATFMADGKEVAKVQFTVENTSITEPDVPAKAGYTGKWEAYKLGFNDIVINAVYTAVSGDDTAVVPSDTTDKGVAPTDSDDGGTLWILWLIIIILVIIIIILIILLVLKKKTEDDDDNDEPPTPPVAPPPASEPAPVVEETKPEPVVERKPTPVVPAAVHILNATSRGIINLSDLEEYFEAGDTVSLELLKEKKLVSAKEKRLKVLGNGVITKPMTVVADYFSGAAMEKIREAGGTPIEKK